LQLCYLIVFLDTEKNKTSELKKLTDTLISVTIAFAFALVNCFISTYLVDLTKGNNYSDVGVPMYSNSAFAMLTGFLVYFIIGLVGFLVGIRFLKIKSFRQIYILINILVPWLFFISIALNI
jgi:hypothetical protein